MKMLIPVPTRFPATRAIMAGAGAWNAAILTPTASSNNVNAK